MRLFVGQYEMESPFVRYARMIGYAYSASPSMNAPIWSSSMPLCPIEVIALLVLGGRYIWKRLRKS